MRNFVNLINRLNFESFKIIALKQYLKLTIIKAKFKKSKSLLVINNVNKIKKQRYKLLCVKNYIKNSKFLFVNYFYIEKKK